MILRLFAISTIIAIAFVAIMSKVMLPESAAAPPAMTTPAAALLPAEAPESLLVLSDQPLPGNLARLQAELTANAAIRYRILVVNNSGSLSKTEYMEQVAATWGEPKTDTLLLVLFAQENYDIRFFMGRNLTKQGATVTAMLDLLRSYYFPRAQRGDAAGGLTNLIQAVNHDYGAGMHFPDIDPRVPEGVRIQVTRWANRYLSDAMQQDQPDHLRIEAAMLQRLNRVELGNQVVYQAVYGVKPARMEGTHWVAGNGQPQADGWIVEKSTLLEVIFKEGEWLLASGL